MRNRLIELIGSKVCGDYSPTCDEWNPHSCEKCYANSCKIGELADHLLANGVVVPPCKVGDTIWFIKWYEEGKLHKPISRKVIYFSWKDDDITIHFRDGAVMSSCIGEFAFLSREEAEAKL